MDLGGMNDRDILLWMRLPVHGCEGVSNLAVDGGSCKPQAE